MAEPAPPAQSPPPTVGAAPLPYGIAPYVVQTVARIDRHFLPVAGAAAQRRGEAFVVGVFGEWGSGKSTVLQAIGAHYDGAQAAEPPKVPAAPAAAARTDAAGAAAAPEVTLRIEFNAWRFEREEHLLIPLLKTLQRTLDAHVAALKAGHLRQRSRSEAVGEGMKGLFGKPAWSWLADRAQLLGACTIALTRMVKVKAGLPGFGEVELDPAGALKAAQEQIDRAAKLRDEKGAPARALESLYYDLYDELQRLTRGLNADDTGRLNFVILVDDLDRCLPEKAVEMLEAIKLFLDVEGCAFVLALDDEIIERGIAHRYRDYLKAPDAAPAERAGAAGGTGRPDHDAARAMAPPITGHEYLEKIVQLPFRLPRWSRREVREFVGSRFADALLPWNGAPTDLLVTTIPPATPDAWLLDLIVEGVPPMPRNLVRAIELLGFTREVAIQRGLGQRLQAYPVAQMALLQLFAPQVFRFLRRGHAEGWKTFERRLRRDRREFAGAVPEVQAALDGQPALSSEDFFRWWVGLCELRIRQATADPYLGRTEMPLALLLDASRNNRNGFDPRNLFLLSRDTLEVDAVLEPYFSLFAEGLPAAAGASAVPASVPSAGPSSMPPPAPAPAAPPADNRSAAAPAPPDWDPFLAADPSPTDMPLGSARPAPRGVDAGLPPGLDALFALPVTAPAALSGVAGPAQGLDALFALPVTAPVPTTVSPRDREAFVQQLLSRSEDAWRNAITREDQLAGHTLDDRTFDALLDRADDLPLADATWLETLAPLLTDVQMRRLVQRTRCLEHWARDGGLLRAANPFDTRPGEAVAPQRLAFARALELVARHLNPPQHPLPTAVPLAALALEHLDLPADDTLLAYRYVRGLELPEAEHPAAQRPRPQTALWAAQAGLMAPASALVELRPGLLAVGDVTGVVQIFSRAARGRWECAASLRAHAGEVTALCALRQGGMASVALDGTLAIHAHDGRGRWQVSRPQESLPRPIESLTALCQLGDGSLLVGSAGGALGLFEPLPSGEWSGSFQPGFGANAIRSLAAICPEGCCVVPVGAPAMLWRRQPGGSTSMPLPADLGQVSAAVSFGDDAAALVNEAGEIVLLRCGAPGAEPRIELRQRLSAAPFHALRAMADGRLVTCSALGQVRLWAQAGARFENVGGFETQTAPLGQIAPLCDGRLAAADLRGLVLMAPDASGGWRQDEVASAVQPGVPAVAGLSADRVAFVEDRSRLRIANRAGDRFDIEHTGQEHAPIVALAAIDADSVAFACADGKLACLIRSPAEGRWTYWLAPSVAQRGRLPEARWTLAGRGGWLLAVFDGVAPQRLRREDVAMLIVTLPAGEPTGITAAAIDENGRCALAGASGVWVMKDDVWKAVTPGGSPLTSLEWMPDGELLGVPVQGDAFTVNPDNRVKRVLRPPLPGNGWPLACAVGSGRMAYARGAADIELDGGGALHAVAGAVMALSAAGGTLFVGADALYAFDLAMAPPALGGGPVGGQRLRIHDGAALSAGLDAGGRVTRLEVRRLDAAPWRVLQGARRVLPDDALLQACVAVYDAQGGLGDITTHPLFAFSADRCVFTVEDPA